MSSIYVCPLCGEVARDSDEQGPWLPCSHAPYEDVEPVEIDGRIEGGELRFRLPDADEWKATIGAAMLEKDCRKLVDRINWLGLSCEQRQVIKAERLRKMPLEARMLMDIFSYRHHPSPFLAALSPKPIEFVEPCGACGDVGCEHAQVRRMGGGGLRGVTVRVEGGSL